MKNYRIYLGFGILLLAMLFLYPKDGKFRYEYSKGRPWIYETLIANFDFPLLKTEAEILREKEAKASEIIDYYNFDETVEVMKIEEFSKFCSDQKIEPAVARSLAASLGIVYKRGVISGFSEEDYSDKVIFIKNGKRYVQTPAVNVLTIDNAYNRIVTRLSERYPSIDVDSVARAVSLKNYIAPNLVLDENTTQIAHKEAVNFISPTKGMIYSGQLIVSKGEIVTADISQILDSYKAEYKVSFGYAGSDLSLWLCHFLIVLALCAVLFFSFYFIERNIFKNIPRLLFLLLMVLLAFVGVVIAYNFGHRYFYIMPFTALVLFINAFFKKAIVYPVYIVSLLPLILIPEGGIEYFLMYAAAGGVLLFSYKNFSKGWKQFLNAFFIFFAMMIVYLAFNLLSNEGTFVMDHTEILFIGANAVLTVVLYPFVFVFEKIFGFVSYSRLQDLADTNNPLLQELQKTAPGTFQHSLQVANLAENAARKIGAYFTLVKVGALYHDVGKIENPLCFVENRTEGTEDYHANLSPEESARDIIRHVDDGMFLARRHKLPTQVSDFIISHHGTGMATFFYNTYCNAGGDATNTVPFTYNGRKPLSKEEVILMLADSVEAASRSIKDYNEESISKLVDDIVLGKVRDNQLEESDISLKEINNVKDSFKDYLMQMHHTRIAYPKRKGKRA